MILWLGSSSASILRSKPCLGSQMSGYVEIARAVAAAEPWFAALGLHPFPGPNCSGIPSDRDPISYS